MTNGDDATRTATAGSERAVRFSCGGDTLVGILHPGMPESEVAVVIVVGGPQYRIGSHRQFVHLARHVAGCGIPVLRFDMRGMGDSGGIFPGFEAVDDDIAAGINAMTDAVPSVRRIVLWGLCDGASAIAFYAHTDPRVAGAVLLNPWVRTEESLARTHLRHYYLGRLMAPDLWRGLISGKVDIGASLTEFVAKIRLSARSRGAAATETAGRTRRRIDPAAPLPERVRMGLAAFDGKILLVISGNDLTAQEFVDATQSSPDWAALMSADRVERFSLPGADHTLSRLEWANAVAEKTADWTRKLLSDGGTQA